MTESRPDSRYPVLQLGNIEIDMRDRSSIPADFSTYFPPHAIQGWTYEWGDGTDDNFTSTALFRTQTTLRTVVKRLNLLGWGEDFCKELFDDRRRVSEDIRKRYSQRDWPSPLTYEAIEHGIGSMQVASIQPEYDEDGVTSPWHQAAAIAMAADNIGEYKLSNSVVSTSWFVNEIRDLGTAAVLHLFAKNPANLDLLVTWYPFHEDYYAQQIQEGIEIRIGAGPRDQILLVTEGKSDTNVIRKALSLLRPDFEDFFTFVDMSENYPFTGVGHLTNFYKGLHKISMQNNVIVIFDNDAEGVTKFLEAQQITEMPNILPFKLPDLPTLSSFETTGPTGIHLANVNGRASSIECFLDLHWGIDRSPIVRWTSYQKAIDEYQGELISKNDYTRRFLEITPSQFSNYDSRNLEILLDGIFDATIALPKHRNPEGEIYF